jgi:hypothetical protein
VDFDCFPHPIDVVGIAACESVERGSVLRIDDEKTADRRFAVVGDKRAGGDHADPVIAGLVQMDSVLAIEFGACGENAFFVDSMNYELQRGASSQTHAEDQNINRLRFWPNYANALLTRE